MGNNISIEGDKIIYYYHNIHYFKKIFSKDNDGIVVDLIQPEQFNCDKPNQLDMSPIHDGILLKPVYKEELLKNNSAESDYRIITEIGTLPKSLQGKPVTPSIIFIKDGKNVRI